MWPSKRRLSHERCAVGGDSACLSLILFSSLHHVNMSPHHDIMCYHVPKVAGLSNGI